MKILVLCLSIFWIKNLGLRQKLRETSRRDNLQIFCPPKHQDSLFIAANACVLSTVLHYLVQENTYLDSHRIILV